MRLVFAGTPEVAVPSLDALIASSHEVLAVVTRPDAPAGRGRVLVASPVRERAQRHGLEVLTPNRPSDRDFLARLRELAPDAAPIVAYGGLIPLSALTIPRHGWINLHFSLLPAWRGAAPVQRAIMAGDEVTGVTTFVLEEGLDTGPTLGLMTETIRPTDTAGDLLGRLAEGGAGLLVATLDALGAGELKAVPQPGDGISLAPKISVEDARVRWETPALAVDRQIRGCTPAPGAWTTFRGERLKIHPVTMNGVFRSSTEASALRGADPADPAHQTDPADRAHPADPADRAHPADPADPAGPAGPAGPTGPTGPAGSDEPTSSAHSADLAASAEPRRVPELAPGELLVGKRAVLVGTGSGLVRLGTVQARGKKPMAAADWARGARIEVAEVLGDG